MDDDLHAEVHRALLEWKVLFFRDQDITQAQQRAFAERWGELEQHPFYKLVQQAEKQDAADVVRLAKGAASPGFENEWHQDVTWSIAPSFGAVLRAVEVPDRRWRHPVGRLRRRLRRPARRACSAASTALQAVHDWRRTFGLAMDPAPRDELDGDLPAGHPPGGAGAPGDRPQDALRQRASSPSASSASTRPRATPC